jgi:hypothetical protein
MDIDPLARRQVGIHAANRGKVEKTLVINVLDLQPNLVGMADDHDFGQILALAGNTGEDIAHHIRGDFVTKWCDILTEHPLGGLFVPGRAGGIQQYFKKLQ